MNPRKILQTDLLLQGILSSMVVIALAFWWWVGLSGYWLAVAAFLCLLSWQFFSGIYIAIELRRWYRGALPMCLLGALVISILLMVMGTPMGVITVFGAAPVISVVNLVVCIIDFQHNRKALQSLRARNERILDSNEIF